MAEDTGENSENYLKEVEEGRVLHNLHLLELKFIGSEDEEIDQKTRGDLLAIQNKGSRPIPTGVESGIFIFYNTETGVIGWPEGEYLGDYSVIRTMLVEKEDPAKAATKEVPAAKSKSREILLYRPGNMPSAEQYSAAMMGEAAKEHGHRRVMPERISPQHVNLSGVEEVWGETSIAKSAKGDLIMLKSIRQFNDKHGPSK